MHNATQNYKVKSSPQAPPGEKSSVGIQREQGAAKAL